MKRNILILIIVIVVMLPGVSHAFGLLKYFWDGMRNQFGLDRGPIPKVSCMRPNGPCQPNYLERIPRHTYAPALYLQANGF